MRQIDLHQAFMWVCEDCGRDNFERAVVIGPERYAEFGIKHVAEQALEAVSSLKNEYAGGIEYDYTLVTNPDHVTCKHCGAQFESREDIL